MLIQGIGWLGTGVFLLSYQLKNNRRLFLFQVLGCGLFCLQFLLMGAYSGCLSLVLNMVRGLMLTGYNDHAWIRKKCWGPIFCALAFLIMLLTWAGPVSILAFVASGVSMLCYWTNNAGVIRMENLCCASPCWIAYDAIVGSWAGVTNECFTMLSILISLLRYGRKALFDSDSDFQK